jgi:hypothetical protein
MSALTSRIDEIDVQVEKIHRLIEGGSRVDPELGAGLATTEPMSAVQRKIDHAAAASESFDRDLRDLRDLRDAA